MTLRDLAAATGLSVGLLSQVERDRTDPSLETLRRIGRALDLPIFSLFQDAPDEPVAVVRHAERVRLRAPHGLISYTRVSPGQGRLEVLEGTLEPRAVSSREPWSHPSEECTVVLHGTLVVEVAGERHKLEPGDSCRFDSRLPHRYLNESDSPATFLVSVTPPSY